MFYHLYEYLETLRESGGPHIPGRSEERRVGKECRL